MARPKRTTQEQFEDTFADWDIPTQEAMLATLTKLHRWCRRERGTSQPSTTEPEQPLLENQP